MIQRNWLFCVLFIQGQHFISRFNFVLSNQQRQIIFSIETKALQQHCPKYNYRLREKYLLRCSSRLSAVGSYSPGSSQSIHQTFWQVTNANRARNEERTIAHFMFVINFESRFEIFEIVSNLKSELFFKVFLLAFELVLAFNMIHFWWIFYEYFSPTMHSRRLYWNTFWEL